MKTKWIAIALVTLIVGCSSPVKLDEVPVTDKSGTSVTSDMSKPTVQAGGVSNVTSVDLGAAKVDTAMPVGSRVVYFDYDSFAIRQEFQPVIEAHAKYLKASNGRKAVLEGHTDERGGREYNLALGQKRAEALRRALTLLGVPDGQLEAVSYGKEKPAVPGSTEAAMEKNRRAEISYR